MIETNLTLGSSLVGVGACLALVAAVNYFAGKTKQKGPVRKRIILTTTQEAWIVEVPEGEDHNHRT